MSHEKRRLEEKCTKFHPWENVHCERDGVKEMPPFDFSGRESNQSLFFRIVVPVLFRGLVFFYFPAKWAKNRTEQKSPWQLQCARAWKRIVSHRPWMLTGLANSDSDMMNGNSEIHKPWKWWRQPSHNISRSLCVSLKIRLMIRREGANERHFLLMHGYT